MAHSEGVVDALFRTGKSLYAPVLTQRRKTLSTTGQQLVGVCLVSHVPDDLIPRGIEHIVKGDGQFDRSQAGGQMSPFLRHDVQNSLTDLLGQLGKHRAFQLSQIVWRVDAIQVFQYSTPFLI